MTVHTATADPYTVAADHDEEPGRYFHPLLATLITGAARLMLATAERLILDEGLEWAFCDTDSMAIAKPEGMDAREFQIRVDRIVAWFAGLNPYDFGGSILKVEDQNYGLVNRTGASRSIAGRYRQSAMRCSISTATGGRCSARRRRTGSGISARPTMQPTRPGRPRADRQRHRRGALAARSLVGDRLRSAGRASRPGGPRATTLRSISPP